MTAKSKSFKIKTHSESFDRSFGHGMTSDVAAVSWTHDRLKCFQKVNTLSCKTVSKRVEEERSE